MTERTPSDPNYFPFETEDHDERVVESVNKYGEVNGYVILPPLPVSRVWKDVSELKKAFRGE